MKPSYPPTIQNGHPRRLTDLNEICSPVLSFSLVPKPTRRYLRKLSLEYLCCPDCESKEITFYGKSSSGIQKYRCKSCNYQFVAQFDALFPRSRRRELFEREYMENLAATGFKKGTGRKEFWEGARVETMQKIESQQIRVRVNRLLKTMTIQSEKEYQLLCEFILHEAYVSVMG
jgi:hypothetical protein